MSEKRRRAEGKLYKKGRLSHEEENFIYENAMKMPPTEMSKKLNRDSDTIRQYMDRHGIDCILERTSLQAARDERLLEKRITESLYKKHFWKVELPNQLTSKELASFEALWIGYVKQFGEDILTSEEFELKDLIMQDILKDREMREAKELRTRKEKYQRALSDELGSSARNYDVINSLEARISALSDNILAREKSFKDLIAQQDKIRKNLTKIRTQRTEDLDKAKIDFSAAVKILETDFAVREREAKQSEALKRAMRASYEDMGSYKKYADNKLDIPILNSETVKKND